jgi:hypothetical protein
MEKFIMTNDVTLLCVTANSFPEGITEAHERLRALLPSTVGRNFYGISSPNQRGVIVYHAATEQQYVGEAEELKLEMFTLMKGEYIGEVIHDYPQDVQKIGRVFREILSDPQIDHQGCCVELYLNDKDVQCMVRTDSSVK